MKTMKTAKGTELPLQDIKGKPYLTVQYRIMWFNEERPNWRIETNILNHDDLQSTISAIIKDENGAIVRTAHKQESKKHFEDHLEKAETGAIGRALGLLGYGTQFALELDELERIVDAPVSVPQKPGNLHKPVDTPKNPVAASKPQEPPKTPPKVPVSPTGVTQVTTGRWQPSPAQCKRLYAIAYSRGLSMLQVDNLVMERLGTIVNQLLRPSYDAICQEFEMMPTPQQAKN